MSEATPGRPSSWRTVLISSGAALAALTALKFLYLLVDVDFDISQAPVAFIIPTLTLIVGVVLAVQRRRIGVWIIAVVALILGLVLVAALVRLGTAQQNWADTVLVFAGIPLAVAAVVAARPAMRD